MDGLSQSTGLPLLSGPPPPSSSRNAEMSCRKCSKDFNVLLFTRARRCSHCGYAYCHSCTDYQALMPRQPQGQGTSSESLEAASSAPGYDSVNVCAFCIELLQMTAASRGMLRDLPLSKLKKYAAVYNIRIEHAVEKEDVIDAILGARRPNGCLPPANEIYYRKYSVPNRSSPSTLSSPSRTAREIFNSVRNNFTNPPNSNVNNLPSAPPPPPPQHSRPDFARPDLEPGGSAGRSGAAVRPRMQPYSSAPSPPPRNTVTRPHLIILIPHPGTISWRVTTPRYPPQQQNAYRYPSYNGAPRSRSTSVPPGPPPVPQSARPASTTSPPRARSTVPPPSLDELLEMTTSEISSLSISALKTILYQNHVSTGGQQILEKGDLVRKVEVLVEDEKRERQAQEERERLEDEERIRRQHEMMEAFERERAERAREREEREQEESRRDESAEQLQVVREDGHAEGSPMNVDEPASPPRAEEADAVVVESANVNAERAEGDESAPPVPPPSLNLTHLLLPVVCRRNPKSR
ncbi:hypothetical protein D9757_005155 [Collybiopsis confluens]|uniref:FYVE-type domain-containing protein n=1 Tax=Collybiopsis confluens TaxID=2823264 RepID=A0A8H5HTF4_9AGAR|nr:hypothetical protein D9757_005155 [Collybiopsis confluens]